MMRRVGAGLRWIVPMVFALVVTPLDAQTQAGRSVIDDMLTQAQNSYNDLEFARAENFARQVLTMPQLNLRQRVQAWTIIAAAAYPDESSTRRTVARDALRTIVRMDFAFAMPQELSWPGLTTLVEEVKRTTFAMQVTADTAQTVAGDNGRAVLRVRSSRPGRYSLMIAQGDSPAIIVDSVTSDANNVAEFRIPAMRQRRPLFASGTYDVIITGVDPAASDTLQVRYAMIADAPPLQLASVDLRVDSTKLLRERSGRSGVKSIFPAILVGAAAYAFSNALRPEGGIQTQVDPDPMGMAVGGALVGTTIIAGFLDRGRPIPANIAANKAYGEAIEKSIADARLENERRLAEYRTTIRFNLEAR